MGRRYKRGTARSQEALLPPGIEDYLGADNRPWPGTGHGRLHRDRGPGRPGFVNASGDLAPGLPRRPELTETLPYACVRGIGRLEEEARRKMRTRH
jgi:hypothetical protein